MFSSLSRWFRGRPRTVCHRAAGRKKISLYLEPLEDRCVPTAGVLDPTFGGGSGFVVTSGVASAASPAIRPFDLGVRADGKLVAVSSATNDFAVVRYNSGGSLDTSFGGSGIVKADFNKAIDIGTALAVVGNKTLIAGIAQKGGKNQTISGYTNFALARYNDNGSLDTTFGSAGKVQTSFGDKVSGKGVTMAVQPDGKFLVMGSTYDSKTGVQSRVLVRYNSTGSLDSTFGSGGKVVFTMDGPHRLAVQADGKIVIAGNNWDYARGFNLFVALRLNGNGSVDTAFGSGGLASTQIRSGSGFGQEDNVIGALTIQAGDGKIVLAGSTYSDIAPAGTGYDVAVVRFDVNGTLDTTFDSDGIVTVHWVTQNGYVNQDARAVTVQADGKLLLAGAVGPYVGGNVGANSNTMLLRLNADGSTDGTFGTDGHVETAIGASGDGAYAIALQRDGRAVIAGASGVTQSGPGTLTLARYLTSAPQIGSFTANPNPVSTGSNTTLTASGITDGNPGSSIIQVAFYLDSDNNGILDTSDTLLGYGSESAGLWSFDFTANLTAGSYTLFAQAEDSYGVSGDPFALALTVE